MDSSDSDGSEQENPTSIIKVAKTASLDLLPDKSKERYETTYKKFEDWCKKCNAKEINEDLVFTYMLEKAEILKPTSLWSQYSMLTTTVKIYKNIDIKYPKVLAYLKKESIGHRVKKSRVFERTDIDKFLEQADDDNYLMMKVAVIIGLASACRRKELCKLTVDDIEVKDGLLFVKIPDTKSNIDRMFIVVGERNITLCKRYMSLRPAKTPHRRLFLFYKSGRCTVQPIGIQTMGSIPRKVAKFLKLANPEEYTGQSLRKSSATLLVNGSADITNQKRQWGRKATSVADDYISDSIDNKMEMPNGILAGAAVSEQECLPGTLRSVMVSEENNITFQIDNIRSIGTDELTGTDDFVIDITEEKSSALCDFGVAEFLEPHSSADLISNTTIQGKSVTSAKHVENCSNNGKRKSPSVDEPFEISPEEAIKQEKSHLEIEYLKLRNHRMKLEILKLEQELNLPNSEFTAPLYVTSDIL